MVAAVYGPEGCCMGQWVAAVYGAGGWGMVLYGPWLLYRAGAAVEQAVGITGCAKVREGQYNTS